ncbi:hypothetical protein BLOT_014814 [Blomia tropicalis]|nr:hypothetical protein BLOT_014814 [Blomia tropicalis]
MTIPNILINHLYPNEVISRPVYYSNANNNSIHTRLGCAAIYHSLYLGKSRTFGSNRTSANRTFLTR